MGYMDISIVGSDGAADAMFNISSLIAKALAEELKDPGNELNTPGCVNVALIFDEVLNKNHHYNYSSELVDVAKSTLKDLESTVSRWKNSSEWKRDDPKGQKYHVQCGLKLIKSLKKYLSESK